jgi:uncharacterized protein (DUF4415 family)
MGKNDAPDLTPPPGDAATDEAPELDAAWFARARPAPAHPELAATLAVHGRLGRPPMPAALRKQRVTLHLDPDVLARLRAEGPGWQTRANAALRAALGLSNRG